MLLLPPSVVAGGHGLNGGQAGHAGQRTDTETARSLTGGCRSPLTHGGSGAHGRQGAQGEGGQSRRAAGGAPAAAAQNVLRFSHKANTNYE
jgi:hypothetical protein